MLEDLQPFLLEKKELGDEFGGHLLLSLFFYFVLKNRNIMRPKEKLQRRNFGNALGMHSYFYYPLLLPYFYCLGTVRTSLSFSFFSLDCFSIQIFEI